MPAYNAGHHPTAVVEDAAGQPAVGIEDTAQPRARLALDLAGLRRFLPGCLTGLSMGITWVSVASVRVAGAVSAATSGGGSVPALAASGGATPIESRSINV